MIYTGKLTYRAFVERVKSSVRQRARESESNDVWPTFYMYGDERMIEVPIPPQAFETRASKDRLAGVGLPMLIEELRPAIVAVQYEMFEVAVSVTDPDQQREFEDAMDRKEYPDSIGYPREHPDRFETIHIHVIDAERHETYRAIKKKRRKGDRLGPWQDLGVDAMSGLMVDPIKEAMR